MPDSHVRHFSCRARKVHAWENMMKVRFETRCTCRGRIASLGRIGLIFSIKITF